MVYAAISRAIPAINANNFEHKDKLLIYRGQVYKYVPRSPKAVQFNQARMIELIYRGQIYNSMSPIIPNEAPRAVRNKFPTPINWRFQIATCDQK